MKRTNSHCTPSFVHTSPTWKHQQVSRLTNAYYMLLYVVICYYMQLHATITCSYVLPQYPIWYPTSVSRTYCSLVNNTTHITKLIVISLTCCDHTVFVLITYILKLSPQKMHTLHQIVLQQLPKQNSYVLTFLPFVCACSEIGRVNPQMLHCVFMIVCIAFFGDQDMI